MPDDGVCEEESHLAPINPYGHSKLMTEHMLRAFFFSSDFRYVILRYFNVSGADPEGLIGQSFNCGYGHGISVNQVISRVRWAYWPAPVSTVLIVFIIMTMSIHMSLFLI